ncbi:hypothetical protein [Variovorax sp. E3]|uniref:hypothetical protein n=1 Tax=Variovorax sp. E3 TaxID=1914993 RepID=UPI0018DC28BB|nr:hypothetical protein [Variovorax sp. E3]
MTGLAGWVEVFKAGDHIDSKGRQISFSQADLDEMIANHELGAAPAVLGHPKKHETVEEKTGAPAYAWTQAYKREGDVLFAQFADINPAFEAGVKSKAYRNRSLSVFKDPQHGWRVRHVGWLGAEPPAIEGLAPVEFAGNASESFEFSAPGYSLVWGLESVAKLLRGLRDRAIEKDGLEEADRVLPQWQIDSAMEAAARARTEFQEADDTGRLFSQSDNPGGSMSITPEQLEAAVAKARKEEADKAKADFASKDAELILLKGQRQTERIGAQIKGWKAEGKVLPAEEHGLAEFMANLEDAGAEFTFSASDGKEAKKTPSQFFAEFMAARAPVVKLGKSGKTDDPGPGVDKTNARAIAAAAAEFQASEEKAGREISIEAAVERVTRDQA